MDEKNINQDNINDPVIPDDVILDDVIKDEEPTPPVEEKNVKLIPPYIFAIIVSVLSVLIAVGILWIQYKQNPRCVDHADANGDRLCDTCGLVIDNVNVPPHTHYYVEGVCQCGFVDVNYVAPPKTDYTSDVNNAVELFNDIFYGSYTKLENNATLVNLDISGSLASVLFAEGTPEGIALDKDKIRMNITKLGIHTQKNIWITDDGQYTTVLTNNEITATWQPKSLGVSKTLSAVLATNDDIIYNAETGYFEVSRDYLNNIQGSVMSPAFYILNQVPGLEDMDYNDLEYVVKFKINENNELTDFEIKGLADTKDVVSVVYSRQESRYQFSMVVRHGVLFQFNIVYSPQGANENFLFNVVIEPAVDMYINAMDLSIRAHITLGNAHFEFDDATLAAMQQARDAYENADKPHVHDYVISRDEPTCTAAGYITHACECGDLYVETLPAIGHEYMDGVCTQCGDTQKGTEQPHEHDYISNRIEPTCLAEGLETFTCICGNSYTETLLALGHQYINDVCVRCNDVQQNLSVVGTATFDKLVAENCSCDYLHECLISITPVTLTWDELMLPQNGKKYGYDASAITYQSVGYTAFEACGTLMSINFPDSITIIDEAAFYRCYNLTTVKISNNVTELGKLAFGVCINLESIDIPDNVVTIGEKAFVTCERLSDIKLGKSVLFIGKDAFENTAYYKDDKNWDNNILYLGQYLLYAKANVMNAVIHDDVTCIADSAFSQCRLLTTIEIPNNVTHIGAYAFDSCNKLTSVKISPNVIFIGEAAFKDCNLLTSIEITEENKFYQYVNGMLYNYDQTRLLWCVRGQNDANVIIPSTVRTIDAYAFADCKNIVSVTIPTSVQCIGASAFENCSELKDVYIEDLSSWCNITFGDLFSNPVNYFGKTYIDNIRISDTLVLPNDITQIKAYSFMGFPVECVVISDGVTSIGDRAFAFCRSLTSVVIPDSVITMGWNVFTNCPNMQFNEYENCKYLGSKDNPYFILVEATNPDLSEYTIHANTKIIAGHAFSGCLAITSIVIPDGVVGIGSQAFNCSNLKSVFMPNSIVSIGESAFYSLTSSAFEIYYNGTQREWNNINICDHNSDLKDAQIHYQE